MAISTGARCVDFVEVEDNDGSCHDYGECCDMSYECCTGLDFTYQELFARSQCS